jgi:sugar phosphate permease
VLAAFRDPPRGRFDAKPSAAAPTLRQALRVLRGRPSFIYNTAAQTIFTFCTGGLAAWMATYFVRARHLSSANATLKFGGILLLAGFVGTLIGGRVGDRMARRRADGHFVLSAVTLIATLPFTLLAILHPSPAIFWPAMAVSLLLMFVNTGPLNAAMANVLPAQIRGRGFGINVVAIHLLGDAVSPPAIGAVSDRIGLKAPVLATALLLVIAGLVLLAGRAALRRDLTAAAAVPA